MRRFLKIFLLLLLSLAFAVFISFVFAIWRAYPRGGDAMVHSLKVFWVLKFFPHHNWWNVWVGGMPHFQFYPAGPNLVMAFVSKIFNFSPEAVMTGALVISMGLAGFFIGLLVDEYSGSFLAGVLTSFVFISTPVMWITAVFYGSYMRPIAVPFMIASVYFALKLVHKPENKKYLFALVIFLALSVYTHLLMGNRAVGLVVLVFIFFVSGFKKKLLVTVKTILLYVLISAYFLIPLFIFSPKSSFRVGDTEFTLDRYRFFKIQEVLGISQGPVLEPDGFFSASPFSISLFILLLLVALILNRRVFKEKLFWFFILGTVGFLVFPIVKIHLLTPLYLVTGGINSLLHLSLIFGIISVGLLIGKIFGKNATYIGFILIVMLSAWVWANFSSDPATWKESIFPKTPIRSNEKDFVSLEVPDNAQYRFGTGTESHLAMIFNRYHPDYPQTRDYFSNGQINVDFNFYLTKAVWDWDNNLDETKFLLDWWAVDKFVVNLDSENLAKYDSFDLVGELTALRILDAGKPPPILSSTNTPTVLLIGKKEGYDVFFRSLAQANIGSSQIIPVWTGIDGLKRFSASELKNFSIIFIYDLPANKEDNSKLLKEYVEQGGLLFIEGPKGGASGLLEPYPVSIVKKDEVAETWNLVYIKHDFGINFESFSPPVFEDGPWGIGTAEDLYPWAEVLVSESDKPVIVGGKYGKGKVVWSGMNLPYHTSNYKDKEESFFIKSIFDWLQDSREISKTDFEVEFVHPEKRIVKLGSSAKGVLFKEVLFPKWRAYLEKGGEKTKLPIYIAGPDFMYIPLSGVDKGDNIILEYKNTPVDFLGAFISLFTLFFLILWLFDWWIFKPWVVASTRKITSPIKVIADWWRREDYV